MSDIVSPKDRSRMMAGISSKDTQPEVTVRKALHARGLRYRIYDKRLPGKPDMVFPRFSAVIEIHGCFWHAHTCHLFKWPSSQKKFWRDKISGNKKRDIRNHNALEKAGWRILIIWECALKGRTRRPLENVIDLAAEWLKSERDSTEIEGVKNTTGAGTK